MADDDAFNKKFFELALVKQYDRQHAFFRDLWIVSAFLAVFLALVLLRFVDLDDERVRLEADLLRLEKDRTVLALLDARLRTVNDTLTPLENLLAGTPDILAGQIRQFDTLRLDPLSGGAPDCPPMTQSDCGVSQIGFLSGPSDPSQAVSQAPLPGPAQVDDSQRAPADEPPASTPTATASAADACKDVAGAPSNGAPAAVGPGDGGGTDDPGGAAPEPLGSAAPGGDGMALAAYLASLPEDDRELLASTELRSPEDLERYDALVASIVNERIVAPHFLALNREKDALLGTTFAAAKQAVCGVLVDGGASLDRFGIPAAAILEPVDAVEGDLRRYRIAPPADPAWWRTYRGKEVTSAAIGADVDDISSQLQGIDARLAGPQREILALIAAVSAEQDRVDAALSDVNAQFEEVRASFQEYAKPLPVVPVDLKDAVLYFPVLLAIAIAVFVGRFRDLQARQRILWSAATEYGLAPDVARAYLGDGPRAVPATDDDRTEPGRRGLVSVVVLALAAPVVLALTTRVILASAAYRTDPGWFPLLYGGAALLVTGTYAVLIWELIDRRARRTATRP